MKFARYSDEEIVALIKDAAKIESPIRQLYKDYFDGIINFIKRNGGTQVDAEDIFQEAIVVFVDLVQRDKFRRDSSVKTFLYSIARNLWLNGLKRKNRTLIRDTQYYNESPEAIVDIDSFITLNESKKQVLIIMDKLGEVCKKILLSYYYENHSMKEIFEKLNYESEQVVRNKKYKCMKQLMTLLDENADMKMSLKNSLVYGS